MDISLPLLRLGVLVDLLQRVHVGIFNLAQVLTALLGHFDDVLGEGNVVDPHADDDLVQSWNQTI